MTCLCKLTKVPLVSIILIASPSYAFNTRITRTRTRTRKELTIPRIPSLRLQSALMSSSKITNEIEEATTIATSEQSALMSSSKITDQTEAITIAPSEPSTPPPSKPPSKSNFRLQLFQILNLPIVEVAAASAVLLSTFLVALSTLDLPIETYAAIENAVIGLNVLFAVDFFLRWYAAGQFKLIYLTKPLAIIDIFVIVLPLFLGSVLPMLDELGVLGDAQRLLASNLTDSSGLQVLLLLRVLRFRRVLTDINTFGRFAVALGIRRSDVRPYQLQLARVLLSIFTLLSVASGLIYTAEHDVNPDIPDYFTALYFGLTTLTTVGFGDIVPVTFNGRLVVSGSILAGVALIPAQAAKLADAIIASQKEEETVRKPMPMGLPLSSSRRKTDQMSSATDGMGPSGEEMVEINDPPNEASTSDVYASYKVCSQCRASGHRTDSSFCWSCGSRL